MSMPVACVCQGWSEGSGKELGVCSRQLSLSPFAIFNGMAEYAAQSGFLHLCSSFSYGSQRPPGEGIPGVRLLCQGRLVALGETITWQWDLSTGRRSFSAQTSFQSRLLLRS